MEGFEPTTYGFGVRCSASWSYTPKGRTEYTGDPALAETRSVGGGRCVIIPWMQTDRPPGPDGEGLTGAHGANPSLRSVDVAVAVTVFALEVIGAVVSSVGESGSFSMELFAEIPVAAYLLLGVGSAALLWRRSRPLPVLLTTLAASFAWDVMGIEGGPSLAIFVSLYSAARFVPEPRTRLLALAGAIVIVIADDVLEGEAISAVGLSVALVVLAWYVGLRARSRSEYLALLEERTEYLERERVAEAQRAVADERTRIARELHDVVAHRVSMITVQAGAAQTVAETDPARAIESMRAVEQAGREALTELREILGVLRSDDEAAERAPSRGLADIPGLVAEVSDAGMEVDLTMEGVPDRVGAQVDLAAYRIVQEALTNVVKHAGADPRPEVSVVATPQELTIEVSDHGSGPPPEPGAGHGLAGMRERAALLDGSFESGPRPGGGFELRARLPLDPGTT